MENKELLRTEEAQRISKELIDKYEIEKLAEMIKDNRITFTFKDVEYRVRMLNQKDKDELDNLKRKRYGQLIQDKDMLFEKEMIKIYKERGIDIEEIDNKLKKLQNQILEKEIKLGEALEHNEVDSILNTYKEEIIELKGEFYSLTVQKSDLLETSIEKTLDNDTIKFAAYLSLEKKQGEEFIRAFDSIDKFLGTNEELIAKAITYSTILNFIG